MPSLFISYPLSLIFPQIISFLTHHKISLSLSLSLYIYIYIYIIFEQSINGDQGPRPPFLSCSEESSSLLSRKRHRLRVYHRRFGNWPAEAGALHLNQSIRAGASIRRWRFEAVRIEGDHEIHRECVRQQWNPTNLGGSKEDGDHRSLDGSGSSEIRRRRPEIELRDSGEAHEGHDHRRGHRRAASGAVSRSSRRLRDPFVQVKVSGRRRLHSG